VMHRNWTGAPLGDLVRLQLGSVQELIGTRIHLHGDETILLNSNAAEVLGLAIHELATNAGKYGSLSGECGTVAIDWDVAGDNLVVRWAERDGPPVAPPARSGFGTIVIKRNPEARLKGQVELDLPPDGLSWTLTAPLAEVLAQAPGQGALPG